MKSFTFSFVIVAMACAVACNGSRPKGATGTPNPPFEGTPPEEAYVYDGETGAYGGMIVLDLPDDVKSFNPIFSTDTATTYVLWYHVFRCLVDYRNGEDPPRYDAGLCTKWEASPDARQWTFYLRKGVRWSDGRPFTADDVMFTYDVVRDKNVPNAIKDIFSEGEDEGGQALYPDLVKVDDHTVRFELHKPNGGFLDAIFNLYIIPKHKWEGVWRAGSFNTEAMQIGGDPKEVVGLGPFVLKEHVSGQRVVLERNPHFWKVDKDGDRLPYLDRVVFVIAKDYNTIQAKFQAGEIDVMSRVRAQEFAQVKRLEGSGIRVEDLGVSHSTEWMAFNQNTGINKNTGRPYVEKWKQRLFRDQKFRQAVSYAIDREGLANTVYVGRAAPNFSFVSPGEKYSYSDDVMKYPYDPERARQLLSEIGLKDTDNDDFLEDAEGHTIEININTNSSNSQRVGTASFIAKNLQDVGIKANSAPIDFRIVINMMQSQYNFDAIVLGWVAGVPPSLINSKNILLSSGFNHICFPNQPAPSTEWEARVNQLVQEMEASLDPAERKRMYDELQRIWSEQLPEIHLVAQREGVAYKTKFGNIRPSIMIPRLTWNVEEIYVKQQ
ncbi:MAG: ABC transporter substrate-binding protein [Blastocatellia bacterium]|nr:ABC transporter substrate-binding protein [Blastocatellia bacterium]